MYRASTFIRARLALGVLARDIADLARGIVGDVATPMLPGERIRAARMVRLRSLNVVDLAVLAELADGASWGEVASALGIDLVEAQRRYALTWDRWQEDVSDDERDLEESQYRFNPAGDPDFEGTATALDQWWRRHADPWDLDERPNPAARVLVDGEAAAGDR